MATTFLIASAMFMNVQFVSDSAWPKKYYLK